MNQLYPSHSEDKTQTLYCAFDKGEREGFATVMTYLFYKGQGGNYQDYFDKELSPEYQKYFSQFVDKIYNFKSGNDKTQLEKELETKDKLNDIKANDVYDYLKDLAETKSKNYVCFAQRDGSEEQDDDLTPSFGDDEDDETSDGGSAPDSGSSSSDSGDSTRQGSDGENVSGDEVCYPEDGSGSSSGSSNGNAEGDEVCYPGDDEGSDSDSGKGSGKDSEDGADDDSYTVGDAIGDIAEQFAIVGPNIPHYRLLWVFSGESLTTIGGDLWDAATRVFSDSSGRLDKVKDSFEKAKSREWELK